MDKLDILHLYEEKGGIERREIVVNVMVAARKFGCRLMIGGGRKGGLNLRYGSIGFAVMDIDTAGKVKVYAQPHPNGKKDTLLNARINTYLENSEFLNPTSMPINTYGHLDVPVEEIPQEALIGFLFENITAIKETYYKM